MKKDRWPLDRGAAGLRRALAQEKAREYLKERPELRLRMIPSESDLRIIEWGKL